MRLSLLIIFFSFHFADASGLPPQHFPVASIFQPINSTDTSLTKQIFLSKEKIKVDVFPGYAVIGIELLFINPSEKKFELIVGFPECESEDCPHLFWERMNFPNTLPLAAEDYISDSDQKWLGWKLSLQPGASQVFLNYGIKTAGASLIVNTDTIDGNGFRFLFDNNKFWNTKDLQGEYWMRMDGGLVTNDIFGLLPDKKFLAGNSVVFANLKDFYPDSSREIFCWYRRIENESNNPSAVSWETKFRKMNGWNPNQKTIATLLPFSATDFEGKKFQHENESATSLLHWSWIAGAAIVLLAISIFVIYERKKKIGED